MKRTNIKIISSIIICLTLLITNKANAQKDILYFLREAPQVTQYNPAITPNTDFCISLLLGTTDVFPLDVVVNMLGVIFISIPMLVDMKK